jgi:hypothetical protein
MPLTLRESLEGIWGAFAESNFWFANLNWTPLVFLKPSSQVNNFTVFFHFFIRNVKKYVFNMLGLGWFRRKEQISAFSEFCNVGARPVYALSFSNSAGKTS